MSVPTTPAGLALLATWRRTGDFHTRAIVEDAIPAIEDEAAAVERTRLLDELVMAVHGLAWRRSETSNDLYCGECFAQTDVPTDHFEDCVYGAVLAAIERLR